MTLAETITRAKGGDWYGHQGLIPGPGHSPDDRSMSVRDKGPDDVVLHSFAGDDWKTLKDEWRADGTLPPREAPTASSAATATPYVYRDAGGEPTFRMVRTMRAGGKSFHAEHPDGRSGWAKGMAGATPLPYRLPELIAAHPDETIYIVEGEKDADNLAALGLVATTNPNGAGKWRASFAEFLSGRECIILPDNDDPGRAHGADVAAKLRAAGIDCVVVELPGLPDKGDVSDWLAAGGTAVQLASIVAAAWSAPAAATPNVGALPAAGPPSSHGLPMEWFRDLRPQLDGMWLIKKLLPATGLALIYGHPGSGKSFLALDFAFHVALGWPWSGRKVRAGLVVYVGAEGTSGLRNRIVAFRQHHGIETTRDVPLVLIPTPIDLQGADADTPRLVAAVREAAATSGAAPALIIVDTLSKTFGGGKEVTDDMAGYVANCQRIASEFGCCVIPVHHRPKDAETEEPRGHGSLKGGVDTVLLVEAGKPKRVRVTKQKDVDVGEAIGFNLIPVTLGTDEDGEPVTSCVVELIDGVPVTTPAGKRLTTPQANAIAALVRAIDENGVEAPAGIPLAMLKRGLVSRVAPIRDWRAAVYAADSDPDKKPDTMLKTFNRAVESLKASDLVQVWEGFAWPTPR